MEIDKDRCGYRSEDHNEPEDWIAKPDNRCRKQKNTAECRQKK